MKKIRSSLYGFWMLMAINNGDVAPIDLPGNAPALRLNQHGENGPRYRHLHGHFWLGVFITKKTLHPIGIGAGIAATARLFGWL